MDDDDPAMWKINVTRDMAGRTAHRCSVAIKFGVTLHTRCNKAHDHCLRGDFMHNGPGLESVPGQIIEWWDGDRRQYVTTRQDKFSWAEVA